MLRPVSTSLIALALTACVAPGDTPDAALSSIDYSLTPCFGFCPAFSLSVDADGTGKYNGQAFVKQRGTSVFSASPEEVAAFVERIAPYRPEDSVSYGYENCDGPVATDSPTVTITWHEAGEKPVTLQWYMGCRQPGLADNSEALYDAWRELPVEGLVGNNEDRRTYGGFD